MDDNDMPKLTISSSVVNLSDFKKPPNNSGNGQSSTENDGLEIKRLASLSRLHYDRERKPASIRLGIGLSALDSAVREERGREEDGDTKGQGRPLELFEPEPWEEVVNGETLLSDLITEIGRFMVMNPDGFVATALWIIHCHTIEASNITCRLAITSPEKQCGKTTLLDILNVVVPRPLSAANTSAAPVFRAIELTCPTLLIDEADTFLVNNDDLRGILNSGHRRGGGVLRTVGEDHEPRTFSTFAAAAIAMIGKLPETLADRSVAIRLRRKSGGEIVEVFRLDRVDGFRKLARQAARWAADHIDVLKEADPVMPPGMFNRVADNWRCLLAIADEIGGEWPQQARRVAAGMAVEDQSVGALLLSDIRDMFQARDVDRLASDDIVAALVIMDDRPWPELKNGKAITKAGLGRQLTKFGINSGTIRFDNDSTLKGYYLDAFKDAFSRYLPSQSVTPSQVNNDGHFSQNQSVTPESPVTLSKCEKPLQRNGCDGVTFSETPQSEDGGKTPSATPPVGTVCAQCRAGASDDPRDRLVNTPTKQGDVWLHLECQRFFVRRGGSL